MTAQPREEKGPGYISNVYKCLEAGCKEDGARSFPGLGHEAIGPN